MLILLVVTELCAPLIQKRQSEKIRIEEDYTQYCTLAEKLMEENEYLIAKMKIEGYTHLEISQELKIQPKRVYYVCDKIKKLLMIYYEKI